MKKKYLAIAAILVAGLVLAGCTQASRVSSNISTEAENFNVERRLVVINTITDTPLYEMVGLFSTEVDAEGSQLEVTVKVDDKGDGHFKKHFFGLTETVTYVIEDITENGTETNPNRYQISYLPESIIPVELKDGSK